MIACILKRSTNLKFIFVFMAGFVSGGVIVGLVTRRERSAPIEVAQPPLSVSDPASSPDAASITQAPAALPETNVPQPKSTPPIQFAAAAAASAEPASYDFSSTTDPAKRLQTIFDREQPDPRWSTQAVDTLNIAVAGMPERVLIGDYALTCKESLCRMDLKGPADQLASSDPKKNVQGALGQLIHEPPASEIFDDYMIQMHGDENTDLVSLTLYLHRRKSVKP
jgi:hypothetical protein